MLRLVNTKEAAAMIGMSARWLRDNKGSFRYRKVGDSAQGTLLWDVESIREWMNA